MTDMLNTPFCVSKCLQCNQYSVVYKTGIKDARNVDAFKKSNKTNGLNYYFTFFLYFYCIVFYIYLMHNMGILYFFPVLLLHRILYTCIF